MILGRLLCGGVIPVPFSRTPDCLVIPVVVWLLLQLDSTMMAQRQNEYLACNSSPGTDLNSSCGYLILVL